MKTVEEVLKIDIKPGWKRGTKITFPGKGNQEAESKTPDDLIFVVDEKPHAFFKRDGNDLVVTQKILLVEALVGKTKGKTAKPEVDSQIRKNMLINEIRRTLRHTIE